MQTNFGNKKFLFWKKLIINFLKRIELGRKMWMFSFFPYNYNWNETNIPMFYLFLINILNVSIFRRQYYFMRYIFFKRYIVLISHQKELNVVLCPVVARKFMHKMKEYETAEIHSRVQEIRGSEKNNFMQPSQKALWSDSIQFTFGWFLHCFLIYVLTFHMTYAECKIP